MTKAQKQASEVAEPPSVESGSPARRFTDWFESLGAYRWLVPVLLVVVLLGASRFEFAQGPEARAAALTLPVVLGVFALLPFLSAARPLLAVAAAVTLLTAAAAELEIVSTIYPPAAVAEVQLTEPGSEATMDAPPDAFRADARAHFGKGASAGAGRVVVEFSRAGHTARVEGEVSKSVSQSGGSRRRAPQAMGSHTLDTVREDVDVPGAGPVVARLVTASGAIGKGVTVSTLPAPPLGRKLGIVLLCLAGVGVAVHVLAARVGLRSDFGSLTALSCVFGYYLPHHFAAGDPMSGVVGAVLAALLVGGLGGWIASALLSRAVAG
jgi:hypothetical protein